MPGEYQLRLRSLAASDLVPEEAVLQNDPENPSLALGTAKSPIAPNPIAFARCTKRLTICETEYSTRKPKKILQSLAASFPSHYR